MGDAQSGNQGMQQSGAVAWHVFSLSLGGLGKGQPRWPLPCSPALNLSRV